jgi:hypothetical protein
MYEDDGFHKISVSNVDIDDFYLSLHEGSSPSRYRRMRGKWEPEVMNALIQSVEETDTYWEIGSAWGYFAMAIAPYVNEIFAFEAMSERSEKIRKSAMKNGYSNINSINGIVGNNIDLSKYPNPDVVLMDVEGFEYEILSGNEYILDMNTTFIIEIHSNEAYTPEGTNPDVNPDGVISILEKHDYSISKLDDGSNYHILASPD